MTIPNERAILDEQTATNRRPEPTASGLLEQLLALEQDVIDAYALATGPWRSRPIDWAREESRLL